ncbi:MAG: PSD1 domain-containing protein [Candidatus Hydrogenedentes bacterium]|nr:PSD1 domain-containing protein [Candidatus Hydrogenedentota bacterium]
MWSVTISLLCNALAAPAAAAPDYATQVRPILERSCFTCHGPERPKSGYRLDVRSIALKGGDSGNRAIVPHDSANSPLIAYVRGDDPDTAMPPAQSNLPRLTEEEVALLAAWIDAGPAWPEEFANEPEPEPPHWSWLPLAAPPIPGDAENPIDAFIGAKLAESGIAPSPEADRRVLIRRVYHDLVGLPPSPEEVDAFCNDPDPEAWEKLVDRLLDSPRHGERWARHWFDTIQFADSHGYEHDIARDNAWRYRDYLIGALNWDTPWPRLIREQLATDHFYPDEPELTPALGFLGASPFDLSTYLTAGVTFDYLARDTLVTQTMAAFASTTANCARCHTHKFDPITQEDYYAIQAVFSGVLKGDLAYDPDLQVKRERDRWKALLAAARANDTPALEAPENAPLVEGWIVRRGAGADWIPLEPDTYLSLEGATLTREGARIVASGRRPEKDTYTLSFTLPAGHVTAIRLDVFAHESFPMNGPGRQGNGNFHLSEFEARVFPPDAPEPAALAVRRATADFNQTDWGVEKAVDGNGGTAWGIHPASGEDHHAVFELAQPLAAQPGARLAITLKQNHGERHTIGAFQLSITDSAPEQAVALPAAAEAALALPEGERTPEQRSAIAAPVLRYVAEAALESLPDPVHVYTAAARVGIPAGGESPTPAAIETPKPVHRMERGDFDKPREEVPPGALSAIETLPARFDLADTANEAARRAALADWLAHPENPLTWRSIVNRVWHYHFGRGLCDTPSDLGRMGGTPSHPELIDWLAVWFRDEARGSLKALHRLIVTSDTYRQSSAFRPKPAAIDGDNRLLWRQNVQRLDADSFRDFTRAVAGTLDLTMGGPGVHHFTQGPGPQLTPALDYQAYGWNSPGAGRRSIYRFVWRGIADPFMEALDFPDLGILAPERSFSASSLQALALYNDQFVLHQSAALAQRLEEEAPTLDAQVARAARLLWYRDPEPDEGKALARYARDHGLPALCRVLLNSNAFLFVD